MFSLDNPEADPGRDGSHLGTVNSGRPALQGTWNVLSQLPGACPSFDSRVCRADLVGWAISANTTNMENQTADNGGRV